MRKALFFFQKTSKAADMAGSGGTIFEFADFRLIPEDNLLLRDGESVPLPPKAFSTLVLLLENHGHLVRKEELIEKIWADAFVEEAAVSRCVWIIRNALGEDSKSQRFIQTVPKRGYKFVADVAESTHAEGNGNGMRSAAEPLNGTATAKVAAAIPADRPAGLSSWQGYAVLAAAIFTVSTIILYLTSTGQAALGAGARTRIAVLPLKPIDAANRSDIYEVGVADALIHRLNSISGVVVRPLSATRKYDAIDQDALTAGWEQQVDYVLASSYQIADRKIRVTSELYDVASGAVRYIYRSEQDTANTFNAQDAIAADVGNRLMTHFSATFTGRPGTRGTSNEEAYRNYQQAQFLLAKSRGRGIESLEKAVTADPNYARAWASLAYAYTAGVGSGGGPGALGNEESYSKSVEAANKALALDPGLAEAYSALCINRMYYESNVVGAREACKRAVDLEPNSATAHAVYAIFLSTQARHDEAIAEIRTAMELEPGSYFPRRWHANFLYWAGRYDEAIVEIKRLLEVNDGDISRYRWLMWSYENQGKYPEAFEALLGLLAAYGLDQQTADRYKTVFQTSGWRGVLVELEKQDGLRFNSYRRAAMNAQLGNNDQAFEFLENAYASRLWEVAFLEVDPAFAPLRDDPRYAELVGRMTTK